MGLALVDVLKYVAGFSPVISRVCRAIMRSSSVGMTKTAAGEAFALMICAFSLVGFVVDLDAHPFHAGEHGLADAPGVLADAAGEDDALDAVDGRGEARELTPDAGDEIVDGVARRGTVGGLEFAHVLGDARHALEAGFLVEEVGDLLVRVIFFSAIR